MVCLLGSFEYLFVLTSGDSIMARRSDSPLEDVLDITSKLPWCVDVSFALISYFFLHWYATIQLSTAVSRAKELSKTALKGLLRSFTYFELYLLHIAFLVSASFSIFSGFLSKKIHADTFCNSSGNFMEEIFRQKFEITVNSKLNLS